MMSCCGCHIKNQTSTAACSDCDPERVLIPCLYATIGGSEPRIPFRPSAEVASHAPYSLCGEMVGPRRVCTDRPKISWRVTDDCEIIEWTLLAYASESEGSLEVFTATTDLDWHTADFTLGPYTISRSCTGDNEYPDRGLCCLSSEWRGQPLIFRAATYAYCSGATFDALMARCISDPEYPAPHNWSGRLAACPVHAGGITYYFTVAWILSPDLSTVRISVFAGGLGDSATQCPYVDAIPATALYHTTVSAAAWPDDVTLDITSLGTSLGYGLYATELTLTLCGTVILPPPPPPPPPPCDYRSTDCFPNCISNVSESDCETPTHVLLFVDISLVVGTGDCCLVGSYDFPWSGGVYHMTAACFTGGDPVSIELTLFCDGAQQKLTIQKTNQLGHVSTFTLEITMTCALVDGTHSESSYTTDTGAYRMCDDAVPGDLFEITIFTNNG